MQNEITQKSKLLNLEGSLNQKGYAKKLILDYDRADIKCSKLKIKEWDYYLIYNSKYAIAMTVADNGYMGLLSATVIDFEKATEITKSKMTLLPLGKFKLPRNHANGEIDIEKGKYEIDFEYKNGNKELEFEIENFQKDKDLKIKFKLTKEPAESMVIATPFEKKKKAFYYNQKVVAYVAEGEVELGQEKIKFSPKDTLAILDWGRGVWTYKNTWYWGAGAGYVNGKLFGFNIGYGFGDTSAATENMLFYNGKAHKLEDVKFNIPQDEKGKDGFLKPWTFTSNDKRFEMSFTPILNRKSKTNALILCSDQNQIFGKFTGTAILDDGTRIELKDFIGFAEKVFNKW